MAIETSAANFLGHIADLNDCPIAKSADESFAAIFKELPPFERLIVSEVCRYWRDISRTPWRDITHLDLSQVPTANIHAVINKCPSLTSVSTHQQNLGDLGRFASRLNRVTFLKCIDSTFMIDQSTSQLDRVERLLRNSSLVELIWHNSKSVTYEYRLPLGRNPSTLKRLQLSALNLPKVEGVEIVSALFSFPQLECFILADLNFPPDKDHRREFYYRIYDLFSGFAALRELHLDAPNPSYLEQLLLSLPALKILYLNSAHFILQQTTFKRLITEHPNLCILVITASRPLSDWEPRGDILTIPARKRFPNGFHAPPVPQLQPFLGKTASEKHRFQPSENDALKIYPIDAPLPEFLAKEEHKAIFDGSWVASRITDGAKDGVNLADYSFEGNAEGTFMICDHVQ